MVTLWNWTFQISSDAGSLHVRKLNRIILCPNSKARRFYKLKDDVTPPILELPAAASSLLEGKQLTSVARMIATLAS